eukprot:TRINITY_DN8360_c0_g1_i1.p2 TRINITY_DN8360_c0_g1~~TRINITY_DN8360_c0_g1_i1.p2  ORF type:complete len:242 (+),score=54.06 TRINITY_DN8360_c0_g1_i1:59-784(+)
MPALSLLKLLAMATTLSLATAASAGPWSTASTIISPVKPWPDQFTTIQLQYQPQLGQVKQRTVWHYDYANNPPRHRLDHVTVRESANGGPPVVPRNSSEWWIGTDLYMYNWDTNTCQHVDFGFGIPRPDWFLTNSTNAGTQWLYRDDQFFQAVQLSKNPPAPYLPFNYYAYASDGTAMRLEAPMQTNLIVVNEFYNFTAEPQPSDLFVLPTNLNCTGGNASTAASWLQWHHHPMVATPMRK